MNQSDMGVINAPPQRFRTGAPPRVSTHHLFWGDIFPPKHRHRLKKEKDLDALPSPRLWSLRNAKMRRSTAVGVSENGYPFGGFHRHGDGDIPMTRTPPFNGHLNGDDNLIIHCKLEEPTEPCCHCVTQTCFITLWPCNEAFKWRKTWCIPGIYSTAHLKLWVLSLKYSGCWPQKNTNFIIIKHVEFT